MTNYEYQAWQAAAPYLMIAFAVLLGVVPILGLLYERGKLLKAERERAAQRESEVIDVNRYVHLPPIDGKTERRQEVLDRLAKLPQPGSSFLVAGSTGMRIGQAVEKKEEFNSYDVLPRNMPEPEQAPVIPGPTGSDVINLLIIDSLINDPVLAVDPTPNEWAPSAPEPVHHDQTPTPSYEPTPSYGHESSHSVPDSSDHGTSTWDSGGHSSFDHSSHDSGGGGDFDGGSSSGD